MYITIIESPSISRSDSQVAHGANEYPYLSLISPIMFVARQSWSSIVFVWKVSDHIICITQVVCTLLQ